MLLTKAKDQGRTQRGRGGGGGRRRDNFSPREHYIYDF